MLVHPVLRPGEHATGPAVVDAEGHAFRAYDVADGTAVLVRPDRRLRQIDHALSPQLPVGSLTTLTKKWSICLMASMKPSKSTGLVT